LMIDYVSMMGTASEIAQVLPFLSGREGTDPPGGPSFQEILDRQNTGSGDSGFRETGGIGGTERTETPGSEPRTESADPPGNRAAVGESLPEGREPAIRKDSRQEKPDRTAREAGDREKSREVRENGTGEKSREEVAASTGLTGKADVKKPHLQAGGRKTAGETVPEAVVKNGGGNGEKESLQETRTGTEAVQAVSAGGLVVPAKTAELQNSASGDKSRDRAESGKELLRELGSRGNLSIGTAGGLKTGGEAPVLEIALKDLRTRGRQSGGEARKADVRSEEKKIKAQDPVKNPALAGTEEPLPGKNVRVVELAPAAGAREFRVSGEKGITAQAGESRFQHLLKEEGIPRIVRQSGIVLKDGQQGEIRLILQPESLGKVRIRLNLQENHIAGRIIVENSTVKDAFNSTLEDLSRALRESGFDSASLEVSVEGQGREGFQEEEGDRARLRVRRLAELEESLPRVESDMHQESQVNLLA